MKTGKALGLTAIAVAVGVAVVSGNQYYQQDSTTGAPLPPDKPVAEVQSEKPIEESTLVDITDSRALPSRSGEVLPELEASGEVLAEPDDFVAQPIQDDAI